MKKKRNSSLTIKANRVPFARAAQSFIAALRIVGNRIVRANAFIADARPMRGRDIESLSIARYFRPKGKLHGCFFACCNAIESVHLCGVDLLRELRVKVKWFTDKLNFYLGVEHVDAVAEFATLVAQILDMSKPSVPSEVRSIRKRISVKGWDALHNLGKLSTAREMKLRFPVKRSSNMDDTHSAAGYTQNTLTDLHELVLDMNATVHRIDNRHKQFVARKKTSEELDAMERMRLRNRTRYRQIEAVADIMASKRTALAQRLNYSAATKRLFKDYKEAGKKVPVGGYPTPGALFQFIHKNRYDFYRLLKARAKTNGVELPAA